MTDEPLAFNPPFEDLEIPEQSDFAPGGKSSTLTSDQRYRDVWTARLLCSNCRSEIGEHCKVHLVPCCPGKCPAEPAG